MIEIKGHSIGCLKCNGGQFDDCVSCQGSGEVSGSAAFSQLISKRCEIQRKAGQIQEELRQSSRQGEEGSTRWKYLKDEYQALRNELDECVAAWAYLRVIYPDIARDYDLRMVCEL